MKNTKIYLVGFILTLYFSFILQGTNNISNEQVNKENRNVVPPLTISNSLICDWNRTWGGADDDGGVEWRWIRQVMCIFRDQHGVSGRG